MTLAGFPHSDISGSPRACRSPKLFAACYVLHRLSAPRHPPSTLSNLTIRALNSCDLCCLEPYRPETHIPLLFLASFTLPLSMIHQIAKINREQRRVSRLCSRLICAWWAWIDSNYRPHAYQACALTS